MDKIILNKIIILKQLLDKELRIEIIMYEIKF